MKPYLLPRRRMGGRIRPSGLPFTPTKPQTSSTCTHGRISPHASNARAVLQCQGSSAKEARFGAKQKKAAFDPRVFLSQVGRGRTIAKYQTNQIVFSQGDAADSVFFHRARQGEGDGYLRARER